MKGGRGEERQRSNAVESHAARQHLIQFAQMHDLWAATREQGKMEEDEGSGCASSHIIRFFPNSDMHRFQLFSIRLCRRIAPTKTDACFILSKHNVCTHSTSPLPNPPPVTVSGMRLIEKGVSEKERDQPPQTCAPRHNR